MAEIFYAYDDRKTNYNSACGKRSVDSVARSHILNIT